MKMIFSLLLSLMGFTMNSHAATVSVKCEGEIYLVSFELSESNVIQNYLLLSKENPDLKKEVASPKNMGNGLFEVNPPNNSSNDYVEVPPYAARTDVTQFFATFMSEVGPDDHPQDYQEQIFCKKMDSGAL